VLRRIFLFGTLVFLIGCALLRPTADNAQQREPDARSAKEFEKRQTEKLLGVKLQNFPDPQGVEDFDGFPAKVLTSQFTVQEISIRPAPMSPNSSYRSFVKAQAADGSVYEAYSGREEAQVIAGWRPQSSAENTRQLYGTHHGYGYNPQNVYIGKRMGGRISPMLFFPDVGSHTTAPYHFAIDSRGMVHLIVADVNIFQENELDLYWVMGDPRSGKWTAAWLIDHRGFTFASHPWSGAWGDKVNVLWHWDAPGKRSKKAGNVGIFFVQWSPAGFGRKERVIEEAPLNWDAAIDPRTGRLFLVYAIESGLYVTSRPEGGSWMRPSRVPDEQGSIDLSVTSTRDGAFIVKTTFNKTKELLMKPLN
jgi:hypothetical protein